MFPEYIQRGIDWIARNDEPTLTDVETISNLMSVQLLAEVGQRSPKSLAMAIVHIREPQEEAVKIGYLNKWVSPGTSGVAHRLNHDDTPACGSKGDLYSLEVYDPGGPYCKRCFRGLLNDDGEFLPGKKPSVHPDSK